ncbi:MAG: ornithine carbamoyltransferase [bacterium]|nr:ornithine carbamoyltransferase [bacterium]
MLHFLSLRDWGAARAVETLDRADVLSALWRDDRMPQSLAGVRVALWFPDGGFRNRLAFELGAQAMGAIVAYMPGEVGAPEPVDDVAAYLANWFDVLVVRTWGHADLVRLAASERLPVVNGRTAEGHPCEILGDLLHLRRRRGTLDGLAVAYVGPASNIGTSWLEAASILPIRVVQVCPPGYETAPALLAELRAGAAGTLAVSHDLDDALRDVDVIYTDCWPSSRPGETRDDVARAFRPYRIDVRHLERLRDDGVFLPCPPVTRGEEVTAAAMSSPRCESPAAKERLLHVQNAILERVALDTGAVSDVDRR